MDMKLIKENTFYKLIQDNIVLVKINTNENIDIHYSFGKLSLKNCQAIERGYDLDELSRNYGNKDADITNDFGKGHREGCYMGYLAGFQKALEILGDKKFSEDDVNLAFVLGKNKDESRINKLINSRLQQTEWDVIIEMEIKQQLINGYKNQPDNVIGFIAEYENMVVPKLDANGCIILKLK